MTTPKRYHAFGRVLESAVPLGELHEVAADDAPVGWRLLLADGSPPDCPQAIAIGHEEIAYGGTVSLALLKEGEYMLTYSDTGVFDLSAPEGVIRWWRPEGCDMDLAAMDILGRVLATILHAEGTVTLHASAVAVDGVAIGFLAPKFHGKSTLAAAMTYVGAQLVSDDALAILPGTPDGRVVEDPFRPKITRDGERHPVARDLPGYTGYMQMVRYRLIPGIW